MVDPISREEKVLRAVRKMLSDHYDISEYNLEINISGGATRINIILMPTQEQFPEQHCSVHGVQLGRGWHGPKDCEGGES